MLTECPNCYNDVLVKSDGTCPACLRSVKDLAGTTPEWTKVTLRHGATSLPQICMVCGGASSQIVAFRRTAPNANYATDSNMGVATGAAGFFAKVLDFISGKSHLEIALQLPRCASCSSQHREVPGSPLEAAACQQRAGERIAVGQARGGLESCCGARVITQRLMQIAQRRVIQQ